LVNQYLIMNYVDIIVLICVFIFLGTIIFFRYILPNIGKNKKKAKPCCGVCPMAYDKKAERFVKEYHKVNKKD
jgi:hypothetical protein